MGDGRDAWDPWPSRGSAQQALSHADISGTEGPSTAWQTNFSAPSFGPMSGHTDAGELSMFVKCIRRQACVTDSVGKPSQPASPREKAALRG